MAFQIVLLWLPKRQALRIQEADRGVGNGALRSDCMGFKFSLALFGYVTLGKTHGCFKVHSYNWVTEVLNSLEFVNIMVGNI